MKIVRDSVVGIATVFIIRSSESQYVQNASPRPSISDLMTTQTNLKYVSGHFTWVLWPGRDTEQPPASITGITYS